MEIKVLNKDVEIVKFSHTLKDPVKRFYVYIHRKISNGDIFYIGKGVRYRCTNCDGRSEYWKNTTIKHGCYVEIYKTELTSEEACDLEVSLISEIGIKNLANISLGGEKGLIGSTNHMYGVKLTGSKNGNFGNKYEKNPLSKPILCFDTKGDFIKRYNSAAEAALDGFSSSCITAVCNRKRASHLDCVFIRESEYKPDLIIKIKQMRTHRKPVNSYTTDGHFIKSYKSIEETKKDGYEPKSVSEVVLKHRKTHFSTIFKKAV
jgi:hypothetical protein